MASPSSTTKLLQLRRLSRALKPPLPCSSIQRSYIYSSTYLPEASNSSRRPTLSPPSRGFCSRPLNLEHEGPSPIDYSSLVQEDEFHKLADSTIHDLLEKLEEYGDSVDIDGFDIDYGNQVLTVKLGTLGNYVLNKQTPNRQIWLSSPVRERRGEKGPSCTSAVADRRSISDRCSSSDRRSSSSDRRIPASSSPILMAPSPPVLLLPPPSSSLLLLLRIRAKFELRIGVEKLILHHY
ncbi:hypothetical protein TEA_029935 [Camellia sinensis var. sinensis]|uniref:Ferroxidase n=1 Tax=Camellia sinensis var. sinensis TaxID=542762 RepID=A0A4S4EJ81_CAMSN|nr:hypothetical protein TEA_029935 [Camellia sinensis var. sinensis]